MKHPDFKIALAIREPLVLLLRKIMQVIYENVHRVPFIDIAFAMSFIDNWVEDTVNSEGLLTEKVLDINLKKVQKLLLKIQQMVIVTNPNLFVGGAPNQLALISIMNNFHDHEVGSSEFWDKCFTMLDNILKRDNEDSKIWKPLNAPELIKLIKILAAHDSKINKVLST